MRYGFYIAVATFGGLFSQIASANLGDFIQAKEPSYQAFFEDLHRNPELGMQEVKTAKKLATALAALGFQVTEQVGVTGVVGIFKNGEGPTVLIRAELDALPMQEDSGLPYASTVPGVTHSCGHDFHITALLAAAEFLTQNPNTWRGKLMFVGEPSEETGAGSKAMLKDGLYTRFPRPDFALAIHNQGNIEAGLVRMRAGNTLAANDSFDVVFNGRGAHGASPHNAIEPLAMISQFSTMIDHLSAREVDPSETNVVTIGKVLIGTKRNIIPANGTVEGMIRTYDPQWRAFLTRRVQEVANGIAAAFGAPPPTVSFLEPVDVVINSQSLYDTLQPAFAQALGTERVISLKPSMASDDFGSYSDGGKIPSIFWFIGSDDLSNPGGINHNPKFRVQFHPTFGPAVTTMVTAVQTLAK